MISTAMLCRIELANGGLHTKVEYWVGIVLHYRRAGSAHALKHGTGISKRHKSQT